MDCLDEEFHFKASEGSTSAWNGCLNYLAFHKIVASTTSGMIEGKPGSEKHISYVHPMFSFTPPSSGMFVLGCHLWESVQSPTESYRQPRVC